MAAHSHRCGHRWYVLCAVPQDPPGHPALIDDLSETVGHETAQRGTGPCKQSRWVWWYLPRPAERLRLADSAKRSRSCFSPRRRKICWAQANRLIVAVDCAAGVMRGPASHILE